MASCVGEIRWQKKKQTRYIPGSYGDMKNVQIHALCFPEEISPCLDWFRLAADVLMKQGTHLSRLHSRQVVVSNVKRYHASPEITKGVSQRQGRAASRDRILSI